MSSLSEYIEYVEAWEPEHGMSVPKSPQPQFPFEAELGAWDAYWKAIERRNVHFGMGRHAKNHTRRRIGR